MPLAAQHLAETGEKNISSIEALSYCGFLNSEAAVDSEYFFEEKMTGDAASACVERSGAPGSYHYEVIAGQEDVRVSYLSRAAATAYAQWKGKDDDLLCLAEANNSDPELKSNISFFELMSNQTAMASAPNATDSWSWENLNCEEKILVGMGGLGFIIGGTTAVNRRYSNERMWLIKEECQRELEQKDAEYVEVLRGQEMKSRGEKTEVILKNVVLEEELKKQKETLQRHKEALQEREKFIQTNIPVYVKMGATIKKLWQKNTELAEALQREREEHQLAPQAQELPNRVYYSEEKVSFTTESLTDVVTGEVVPGEVVEFYKSGSFQGGVKLCGELGEEVSCTMYHCITRNVSDFLKQFKSDLGRSSSCTLMGDGRLVSLVTSKLSEAETAGETDHLRQFLKSSNLIDAIGSIMNQTLGNTCTLVYSQVPRSSKNHEVHDAIFSADGAIGFPSPSSTKADGSPAEMDYELEKVTSGLDQKEESYFLTLTNNTGSKAFYYPKEGETHFPAVLFPSHLLQTCKSVIKLKITSNLNFNPEVPYSKDNLPYSRVECISFRNDYKTYDKSGAESFEMLSNSRI